MRSVFRDASNHDEKPVFIDASKVILRAVSLTPN